MPKYKVSIEFETDKPLKFPVDGVLLSDMAAQLESLEDGTYDEYKTEIKVLSQGEAKVEELNEPNTVCTHCNSLFHPAPDNDKNSPAVCSACIYVDSLRY